MEFLSANGAFMEKATAMDSNAGAAAPHHRSTYHGNVEVWRNRIQGR